MGVSRVTNFFLLIVATILLTSITVAAQTTTPMAGMDMGVPGLGVNAPAPAGGSMGGYNYHDGTVPTVSYGYTDCLSSNSTVAKCWGAVANAPLLKTFTVGKNTGDLWGIETNGTSIVHYNPATKAWIIQPALSGVTQLAEDGSDNVYALANGVVYKFTGSGWATAFPNPGVTFGTIATGADGDFWALGTAAYGCGHQPYHYNGTSWVAVTGQGLTSIDVRDSDILWGSCTGIPSPTNNVFTYSSGIGWATQNGWLSQIAVAPVSRDSVSFGNTLVWGINATPSVYHANATGWDQMVGSPTFIATGGEPFVYALFGNTIMHYFALRISVMYHVYGCTGQGSSCGSFGSIKHTTQVSITLSGHLTVYNSLVAPAGQQIDVQVSDSFTPQEADDCFSDGEGCGDVTTDGSVYCPVLVGNAFNAPNSRIYHQYEFAKTYAVPTGKAPYFCTTQWWLPKQCFIDTNDSCSVNTSPPDMAMNPPRGVDTNPNGWPNNPYWANIEWVVGGACVREVIGTFIGNWSCLRVGAVRTLGPGYFGQCTYNPGSTGNFGN